MALNVSKVTGNIDEIYKRELDQHSNAQSVTVNYLAGEHEIRFFSDVGGVRDATDGHFMGGVCYTAEFIIAESKTANTVYIVTGHTFDSTQFRWLKERVQSSTWLDDFKPDIPAKPGEVPTPAPLPQHS